MTGPATITGWKRTALAAALAYALALQGLLLAFGGALHVQAAAPSGTVLCLSGGEGGSPHQPGGPTDHTLCCLLGSLSASPAGPVPAIAAVQPRPAVPADARPTVDPSTRTIASSVLPVGSRAPPRLG